MKPVRLAVVGAGLVGKRHAELVAASPFCELVAVCDHDPKLQSIAAACKAPFYRDLEKLLKNERPHGAIISTPNGQHANVTEVCATHSVHVLIEKPIADSVADAQRIVRLVEENDIRAVVGHHRRFNPFVQETKSLIQRGDLGRLVAVSMLWALKKPTEYFDVAWRGQRPGGGPTMINLIHELDLLRFLCGEIRQVYAQGSSKVRSLEVEDSLTISLSFENGAIGSIVASDATPSPWSYEATTHENPLYFHTDENCYNFLGTEGSLSFPNLQLWRYRDGSPAGWQHPLETLRNKVMRVDPLRDQLEHFCQVIRGEEAPLVETRDGARSLDLVLSVLESIQTGAPVSMTQRP